MEPYDPIPGRVPRKVAIDRRKKEYASFNIEQLLAEKGNCQLKQILTSFKREDSHGYLFTTLMIQLLMIIRTKVGLKKESIKMEIKENLQVKD